MMGTNYYAHLNECEHCGRFDELHIGKSSAGWCFGLHVYPDRGIGSLEDWKELLREVPVVDEYGDRVEYDGMIETIEDRGFKPREDELRSTPPTGYSSWEIFFQVNHAVKGPNGLLRHKIGSFCIGHGEGTWDIVVGEFF